MSRNTLTPELLARAAGVASRFETPAERAISALAYLTVGVEGADVLWEVVDPEVAHVFRALGA